MQQERVCRRKTFFFIFHCLTACLELAACLKNSRKKLIVNEKSVFEGVQLSTNSAQARNGWNVFALAKGNNSKDNGNNKSVRVSGGYYSLLQACLREVGTLESIYHTFKAVVFFSLFATEVVAI